MLRVVFTVALLAAVVAVTLPAVDRAGVQRSDTAVRSTIDSLVETARMLAAGSDAVSAGEPARRVVTLDLPTDGFASAGLRRFVISRAAVDGNRTDRRATRFSWRVAGGARQVRLVDGLSLRPAGGRLAVETGGRHRLRLELVRAGGQRVVRLRTFK